MLSPVLCFAALGIIIAVAALAFIAPGIAATGTYPAAVKLISGLVAMAGSMYLARAINLTLLRSGGTAAFQAAYIAAAGLCGLGMAEALSALWPANIGYALASYGIVSVVSGVLWVRFYGNTA
jgi:hypothetical protein